MVKLKLFGPLCVLLLSFQFTQSKITDFISLGRSSDITTTVTGAINYIDLISDKIQNFITPTLNKGKIDHPLPSDPAQAVLFEQLTYLVKKQDYLLNEISDLKQATFRLTEESVVLIDLNERLEEIFDNSRKIAKAHADFAEYLAGSGKFDKNRIRLFVDRILSEGDNGIKYNLEKNHNLLFHGDFTVKSVIKLLTQHIGLFFKTSKISMSQQQFFYNYLETTIYTELQGFFVIQYCYNYLESLKEGSYAEHIAKAKNETFERINVTISTFKTIIDNAPRELWKTNPDVHIQGKTYEHLRKAFQKFIINEDDLKDDECKPLCKDHVKLRTSKTVYNTCTRDDDICKQTHCSGYIYDCGYHVEAPITICPGTPENGRNYEYFLSKTGARYGNSTSCPRKTYISDNHWAPIFSSCDSCLCTCEPLAQEGSERFINLEYVLSNTSLNYVITGVRLVKRNHILHLQIQEGKWLPNGQIDPTTVRWSPFNDNPKRIYEIQWNKSNKVFLSNIQAPKDHVLTGLYFEELEESSKSRYVTLQGIATPVNRQNGTLDPQNDKFLSIDLNNSTELNIDDLDIPIRSTSIAVTKTSNKFVKLTTSSLEKDAGQSTIPFLDIQEVTSNPSAPMGGAGLYHKKAGNNAGFLAVQLFTYNYKDLF